MLKAALIAPNSLPIPPIRGGGIQTVVSETVKLYRQFKPYVFSNLEYGVDSLPIRETDGNVEHRRICQSPMEEFRIKLRHMKLLQNYFPYVYEIIGQIKEIKPDVIHLMNRPWFLPILRKYLGNDQKIILHHFNNYLMEMPKGRAEGCLKMVNGFIGCSRFTVNAEVLSRFPQYKDICSVVSNGIDANRYDPKRVDKKRIEELRKKFGIRPDDIVVLYVGRLAEDKGAGELLEAVKILVRDRGMNKIKLLIVGSSFYGGKTAMTPFLKRLHASSEEIKDNIIFTGFINQPEIPSIYALARMVAIPSIVDDASPIVCYEASAMEVPVIGSARGGIPEILLDGKTGLILSDPRNTGELAEKMIYLMNDPGKAKEMGRNGREFIKNNFTYDIVASKLESVYLKVIKG